MLLTRHIGIASVAAALLLAAGCRSAAAPRSASSTVPGSSTAPTSTAVSSQPVGTTSTTASTNSTAPTVAACPTSNLSVSLTNTQGTAGTSYSHLVFRNASSRECTLSGFPGVSFVDASGNQIGAAVPRSAGSVIVVTLAAGGSAGAVFALHDAYVGSAAGCQPTPVVGLRVYPPGQTEALTVTHPFSVCANPATDGSGSIGAVETLANLPT